MTNDARPGTKAPLFFRPWSCVVRPAVQPKKAVERPFGAVADVARLRRGALGARFLGCGRSGGGGSGSGGSGLKLDQLLCPTRFSTRRIVLVNNALDCCLVERAHRQANGIIARLAAKDRILGLANHGLDPRPIHLVAQVPALIRPNTLFG